MYSTRTGRGLLQRCFVGIARKVDTNFYKSLNHATRASHLFVAIFTDNWQRERRKEGGDRADERDESKQRKRRTRGL